MLEAPATVRAAKGTVAPRRASGAPSLRRGLDRDIGDDFSRDFSDGDEDFAPKRFRGVRFRFLGGVPRSVVGRVVVAGTALAVLVGFTGMMWEMRAMLMHDPRLVIASSSAIQIEGNSHMSRPQLLSVFGEDVDRNLLTVPLAARRAELEQLPWVEHATVMRLLPNRLRVAVKERSPVAFVRQSGTIGLVDANGVLLDMGPDAPVEQHYSFPVVTGVSAADPQSVRQARMKMYERFMGEMGTASKEVSEVDLSDPEDVRALMPSAGADILVHFGDSNFLRRYTLFAAHVGEWKSANPLLASVDMRYEHQVVLDMAKPAAGNVAAAAPVAESAKVTAKPAVVAKATTTQKREVGHPVKIATAKVVAPAVVAAPAAPAPKPHLQTAFDVPSKKTPVQAVPPR